MHRIINFNFHSPYWFGITSGSASSPSNWLNLESVLAPPEPLDMPTTDGELILKVLLRWFIPSVDGKLFKEPSTALVVVIVCPLVVLAVTDECLDSFVPTFCSSGDDGAVHLCGEEINRMKVSIRTVRLLQYDPLALLCPLLLVGIPLTTVQRHQYTTNEDKQSGGCHCQTCQKGWQLNLHLV